MATLKFSRQRESIKQYLASTKEHPTADMVYMHLLTDIGEALKITTPDGADRFDGCVKPHNHFFCTECRRVLDLDLDMKEIEQMNKAAATNFDGIIESSITIFYGKCGDCIK